MSRQPVFQGLGQTWAGSFTADGLGAQLDGEPLAGALFQALNFNYAQSISVMYELGSSFVYLVGGRAQGTLQIGAVAGPSRLRNVLLTRFRNLCDLDNELSFGGSRGCTGASAERRETYHLSHIAMSNIGARVAANDVVIQRDMSFIFMNLDIDLDS